TGVWMGLREEGGGAPAARRAWMLLPLLLLACAMAWLPGYPQLLRDLERELALGDRQFLELARQFGSSGERLNLLARTVAENAKTRGEVLPDLVPTMVFVWLALLVGVGRM